jgi:hypothetical protein
MTRTLLALSTTLILACTPKSGEDAADSGSSPADAVGPSSDDTSADDTGSGPPPLPDSTGRRVLHEVFTGSTCGPCEPADRLIEEVLEGDEGRFTIIKWQVGSDPYMTAETVDRIMGYLPGESSYAIPYMHADGINGFHPVEINDGDGYNQANLDQFAGNPSPLLLTVSHTISDQTVDITVDYTALSDIDIDSLVLHAAIVENVTTGNIGTNGQTAFHDVMKKMVPDGAGSALTALTREDTDSLTLSYTFQGSYDDDTSRSDMVDHETAHTVEEFEDLEVVVWIQDTTTWEVFQSAWTKD